MNHYDFGNYLAKKRKSSGYSQFQFGKLLGVSGKAVSKWETGASVPKLETLSKIAALTGTELGDLVSMREEGTYENSGIRKSRKTAFWDRTGKKMAEIYGDAVPLPVLDRYYTEKECMGLTDNPLILAALGKVREMVTKRHGLMTNSLETNASFLAWLAGATNVNPLPPHRICPKCRKTIFLENERDAWDAELRKCTCGTMMINDGHGLPFDVCRQTFSRDHNIFGVRLPKALVEDAGAIVCGELKEFFSVKKQILPNGDVKIMLHQDLVRESKRFRTILLCGSRIGDGLMETLSAMPSVPDIPEMINDVDLNALAGRLLKYSAFLSGMRRIGTYSFSDVMNIMLADNSTFSPETMKELVSLTGVKTWKMLPLSREDVWDAAAKKMGTNAATSVIPEHIMKCGSIGREPGELEQKHLQSLHMPKWFWTYLSQCEYLSSKASVIDFLIERIMIEWSGM